MEQTSLSKLAIEMACILEKNIITLRSLSHEFEGEVKGMLNDLINENEQIKNKL